MFARMSKPTGRARELGANLRYHRERAEWSEKQAAEFLEVSQGQLCRIELGYRNVSEINVARCLAMYGVRGEEFAEVMALATEVSDHYRIQAHNDRLPDELRTLIHHESTASSIEWYEPTWIPGLLQTEDYARALFQWAGLVPEDGIEPRVQARMDRQRSYQSAARYFIHQSALNPPMIGADVMHDQLMKLMFAANREDCEIHIVPSVTVPNGAFGGAFTLLNFAAFPSIVYVENIRTSEFLEDPADLAVYRAIVNRLASIALSSAESREVLVAMAT